MGKWLIIGGLLFLLSGTAMAQEQKPAPRTPTVRLVSEEGDSLAEARNRRLYDSIEQKARRRRVPRFLHDLVFISPKVDTTSVGAVIDQSRLFRQFSGRTIKEVRIDRIPVFDTCGNWLERFGNKIHALTRERVIRRDLLFEAGDTIDPEQLVRNMQLLRERSYISEVDIRIEPDPLDSTQVTLRLFTRDRWTITADLGLRSEGRTMVSLSDDNIFGWGNRFEVRTYFDRRTFDYGGNIFRYRMPNLWGSFYKAEISAGRDFYESEVKFELSKPFIQPTDYEVGASYNRLKSRYDSAEPDIIATMRTQQYDLWGGISEQIPSLRSSLFLTGHFQRTRFNRRPEVGPGINPAFHEGDDLLAGLGLYRENFSITNMIFGYGTREYIATGYKAEITGGYTWGEFRNDCYLGIDLRGGGFTSLGYFMGGGKLGSYISPQSGAWYRSVVDVDFRWFSTLYAMGRSHLRQFIALNYTQGWNRGRGYNETVPFTASNQVRTLTEDVSGINRTAINTETVLFTPFQPLGFRITLFGFADFGVIGMSPNPLRNDFFTSIGLGVRIRNERLIFSAIQIQLGLAIGKNGLAGCRWFEVSNQSKIDQFRYIPGRPEIVGFE